MIYNITHTCGHVVEHRLFGPGRERDRRIEYLRDQECARCWSQKQPATAHNRLIQQPDGRVLHEIVVVHSYALKDTLKARGYNFSRDIYLDSEHRSATEKVLNGLPGQTGWLKTGMTEEQWDAELDWLSEQGVAYADHDVRGITGCILSAGEGRLEVAGLQDARPELSRGAK